VRDQHDPFANGCYGLRDHEANIAGQAVAAVPAWRAPLTSLFVPDQKTLYEVKFANGETEIADSLWGAHHAIARRAAFDMDPLRPTNVLPARIFKLGPQFFGGRTFAEEILSVGELTPAPPD
jgi:hypothetical protein